MMDCYGWNAFDYRSVWSEIMYSMTMVLFVLGSQESVSRFHWRIHSPPGRDTCLIIAEWLNARESCSKRVSVSSPLPSIGAANSLGISLINPHIARSKMRAYDPSTAIKLLGHMPTHYTIAFYNCLRRKRRKLTTLQ